MPVLPITRPVTICHHFMLTDDEDSDTATRAIMYKDRRREAHTHAEQKRRDAIKVFSLRRQRVKHIVLIYLTPLFLCLIIIIRKRLCLLTPFLSRFLTPHFQSIIDAMVFHTSPFLSIIDAICKWFLTSIFSIH